MMNPSGLTIGDHLPDVGIIPGSGGGRFDPPIAQGLSGIAQDRQPSLGQDIEFDQTHRLDRIHIELGRPPSAGTGKNRR